MNLNALVRTTAAALAAAFLAVGSVWAQQSASALDDAVDDMNVAGESAGATAANLIAADFSAFAGWTENADALVAGLRKGSPIDLVAGGTITTFTPATGPMGYGEVEITLSLAKALLERDGITEPTPEQIVAVLNGGSVTAPDGTVTSHKGLLVQRADGAGWGRIALDDGVKLGPVIASIRSGKDLLMRAAAVEPGSAHGRHADTPVRADRAAQAANLDHPLQPERPVTIERPMKPERPLRVERPMRPERPGKP